MWRVPYRNQYEGSNDPWPKTFFGWVVWLVFYMPGSIALWINYMYPQRGQVWMSGRQAQNKIVTVITTLSIYFSIAMIVWLFVMMGMSHH
ncbi:hypothetical protein CWB41_12190 [Methylovirgula ligni]|uniref:Uncharacterized protein n=1 Tax=Methylovirgula ligni TaxID=569860 RepID=A0A3D9YUP1_9HYPH|nr:hypothetical protein [Methylovirgula ligni]QAY96396.1 hypothetical protein CWB41_12190 [Methylovirgula ligni]REF85878.1 hypothetical protein DES32_1916 [Methylovirgula ligni]